MSEKNYVLLAQVIKKLREERNLSARKLSLKSGLSPSYVSLLEKNITGKELTVPSVETISKLAKTLGVSADSLLRCAGYELAVSASADVFYEVKEKEGKYVTKEEFEAFKREIKKEDISQLQNEEGLTAAIRADRHLSDEAKKKLLEVYHHFLELEKEISKQI